MAKSPADAVRRAYRDPQFAQDFLANPEKYRAEYALTDDAIDVLKKINPVKVSVAAQLLSPREVAADPVSLAPALMNGPGPGDGDPDPQGTITVVTGDGY